MPLIGGPAYQAAGRLPSLPRRAGPTPLTGDSSELTGQLVGGIVQAAMAAVERGADPDRVADHALALLRRGL